MAVVREVVDVTLLHPFAFKYVLVLLGTLIVFILLLVLKPEKKIRFQNKGVYFRKTKLKININRFKR